MKKQLSIALVMLSLVLLLSTSEAFAFALIDPFTGTDYFGPVVFKIFDWSIGRNYTFDAVNTEWDPEGARAGLPGGAGSIPDAILTAGDGVEDSWGLFRVTTVNKPNGDVLWASSATEELTGQFYGFDDAYISAGVADTDVGSLSGFIDLYLDPSPDFTSLPSPYINARPPLGGGGDAWNTTDGALFLSTSAVPGIVPLLPTLTRFETVSGLTSPFTGDGSMYLDITGGSHEATFDTNGFLGGTADFFVIFDFTPSGREFFDARSSDPVEGTATPEPASMLLMGIGLLGLTATKLRKKGRLNFTFRV